MGVSSELAHVCAVSLLTARRGWEVGRNLHGVEAHSLTRRQGASSPALRPVLGDSQPRLHTCTNPNHPQTVVRLFTQTQINACMRSHSRSAFCIRAGVRPMTLGQSIPGQELPFQAPPNTNSQGNLNRGGKMFDDRKKKSACLQFLR